MIVLMDRNWLRVSILLLLSGLWGIGCGTNDRSPAASIQQESEAEVQTQVDPDLLERYAHLWPVEMREITIFNDGSSSILLVSPGRVGIRLPVHRCASPLIRAGFSGTPPIRPMPPDLFKSVADELQVGVPVVVLEVDGNGDPVATLVLQTADLEANLPASFGDALTIAQRMDSLILASPQLFEIKPDARRSKPTTGAIPASAAIPAVAAKSLQRAHELIDMDVLDVVSSRFGALIVLLVDSGRNSVLTMRVGICEGLAIFDNLHGASLRSAETHLLLAGLLRESGATMTHANIVDWRNEILFGELGISYRGERISIDSRPSDAIALALLTGAQVGVVRGLLEAFGQSAELYRSLL